MEAQQTVIFGDSMGLIELTNIRIHFHCTKLIWFPEITKWKPQKKHLTQIIVESTQYITTLKDSLIP